MIVRRDGRHLVVSGATFAHRRVLGALPGGRYDPKRRAWAYPATPVAAANLARLGSMMDMDGDATHLLVTHTERSERLTAVRNDHYPEAQGVDLAGLWRHQRKAVWVASLRAGHLLAYGMRSGKTLISLTVISLCAYRRVLVVCPKKVIDTWGEQALEHGLDLRVVGLKDGSTAERLRRAQRASPAVLVINYESVWREPFGAWALEQPWDLVIADECLPTGVPIATPDGDRPIEDLRPGDRVYGYSSDGRVIETVVTYRFGRPYRGQLVEVGGVPMTPNHPVYDGGQYRPAGSLDVVDAIVLESRNGKDPGQVQAVRKRTYRRDLPEQGAEILQREVCRPVAPQPAGVECKHAQEGLVEPGIQGEGIREDEGEPKKSSVSGKPIVIPRERSESLQGRVRKEGSGQGARDAGSKGVAPPMRGKRPGDSGGPEGALGSTRGGMGIGASRAAEEQAFRISDLVQDRHSESSTHGRDRGGRQLAPDEKLSGEGPKEGCRTQRSRMDDPAIHEPTSNERLVYNIETGTGNYFAGGLLVHNCHRLAAPGGKASRYLARLAERVEHRIGLSGTPVGDGPVNAYGIFRTLDAGVFGTSAARFRAQYVNEIQLPSGVRIPNPDPSRRYRNVGEFSARYNMITLTGDRDAADMPAETDTVLGCTLSGETARAYRSMRDELVAELQRGTVVAANALVRATKLHQLAAGHVKHEDGRVEAVHREKDELLAEVLDELGPTEPLVVMCWYVADLGRIKAVCAAAGRECLEISGRADDLREWKAGRGTVLAVQIQAGGVGVDLSRSRHCVFWTACFSHPLYEQARARLKGQRDRSRSVAFTHLVARGTIDEGIYRALAGKKDLLAELLRAPEAVL